ncbi:hypothetical protein ACEWX3_08075 [Mycobacterium sp. G7A2]|uniref:hypothetical protein n=1 Tax=Mycobacterium sp. G7A2 TaxID=3317307 RepID=UPI0035A8AFDF
MPTTTDQPPGQDTSGDLAEPKMRSTRWSAIAIVLASIATLVILFVMLNSSNEQSGEVRSVPAQPQTFSPQSQPPVPQTRLDIPPPQAAPPPAAAAPSSVPTAAPSAAPVIDELGFVDSEARCTDDEQAVAIARTETAAVVICRDEQGDYVYQGVRLSDGASLRLDDVRTIPAGFEARNGATTYRLSATELVVIDGETLFSRDPVVEYREARP